MWRNEGQQAEAGYRAGGSTEATEGVWRNVPVRERRTLNLLIDMHKFPGKSDDDTTRWWRSRVELSFNQRTFDFTLRLVRPQQTHPSPGWTTVTIWTDIRFVWFPACDWVRCDWKCDSFPPHPDYPAWWCDGGERERGGDGCDDRMSMGRADLIS